jgi:hypothetical protein
MAIEPVHVRVMECDARERYDVNVTLASHDSAEPAAG